MRLYCDEPPPVLLEEAQDLVRAPAAGDRLALAQHRARDGVEAVVVHAHEGAAQQADPVEHDAAGHARLARVARAGHRAQRERSGPRPSASGTRSARAIRSSTARSKSITFQPVSTSGSSSRTRAQKARTSSPWVAKGRASVRAVPAGRSEQQDLRGPAAVEADREQAAGRGIGLDVEREHAQARRPVGGSELGVLEDDAQPRRAAGPRRGSPTEPRMPRSIKERIAKRTSASKVGDPRPREAIAQRGRVAQAPRTSMRTTGRPASVTWSVGDWRTAPLAFAASASFAST